LTYARGSKVPFEALNEAAAAERNADADAAEYKNGFYCETYKSVKADLGKYFKNYAFLGKGGNSTVYLAQATSGPLRGRLFVLKGLRLSSDKTRLRRFLEERAFLETVTHPNLMRLIDKGEYYDRPFIIQPYAPKTLRQELGGKLLSLGRALAFSCQLLSALQALHQQNIIHRDIKPENIFVNDNSVQLGDFSLMKRLEDTIDESDIEEFKGYCAMLYLYCTLELVDYATRKSNLDLRSDIFRMGLVVAEMFSGQNPLDKANSITDPITENSVHIHRIKGKDAKLTADIAAAMLRIKPGERLSIQAALDDFAGIFETYAKDYDDFHGSFFL